MQNNNFQHCQTLGMCRDSSQESPLLYHCIIDQPHTRVNSPICRNQRRVGDLTHQPMTKPAKFDRRQEQGYNLAGPPTEYSPVAGCMAWESEEMDMSKISLSGRRPGASLAVLFVAATLLCASPAQAQDDPPAATSPSPQSFAASGEFDLDAFVEYFQNMYRSDSSTAEIELTITKPRRTRTMRMKSWSRGEDKMLIVIESPAREKGTATLKVDKNLWNYLPRIKRTIRIPPSMMLSSWMGSDLTNDDLVRESSFEEDYTAVLTGPSQDPPGWLVTFTANPGVVGLWERFELVVSRETFLPAQAKYYDRKGRLSRTIDWDQIQEFDGRRIPARMTLIPVDDEGHSTQVVYLNLSFDADVPESTFSLSRLEQNR